MSTSRAHLKYQAQALIFVLAGLSIPIWHWTDCERELRRVKQRYDLEESEIHTAWIMRQYHEQNQIANFDTLSFDQRRSEVARHRTAQLLNLQASPNRKKHNQTKKNFRKTADYIHLTRQQRRDFISEVAECVSNWGFARLFAECIDKVYFDPTRTNRTIGEQSFEQIISRLEQFLVAMTGDSTNRSYGLLIHDNNETVAKKHTDLMQRFHRYGTVWTDIRHIIETPLFVDSQLTSMVQIADLCSYSLRRYLENGESDLFEKVFKRADRRYGRTVGVRHFAADTCMCQICADHKQPPVAVP